MKIVLIGRGRLATNLERALLAAGHEVASINSRTLEGLSREADIFIIAVKDSALQDVVREATKGREDQLFVHTAGSMSLNVFEGSTTRYGVFYPMQTFSKEHQADFSVIPFFLEANGSEALATLHALASSISGSVYELTTEERKQLHLAAVFACNFANHCYDMAATLLERNGLSFTVLLPLLILALIVQIVKLPDVVQNYRPGFVVLILIYFCLLDPLRVNVEIAFVTGLLLDFLSGAPLGINALLFTTQLYLIISQFHRFATYTWWQQGLIIGFINLLVCVIGFWIEHIIGLNVNQVNFLINAAIVAALWAPVKVLCHMLCVTFAVIKPTRSGND